MAKKRSADAVDNPFRPGAGHSPPFLAGREDEVAKFSACLAQEAMMKNVILTGLRGVGKTVLMDDRFKTAAHVANWAWVGSDFSEASFLTENHLCLRLITDLSVFSAGLVTPLRSTGMGFKPRGREMRNLDFEFLMGYFEAQPGLAVDKLKSVLDLVWSAAARQGVQGVVFAYDEAQVVCDRESQDQYPLAVLLEAFQSIQRKGARYLLLLTGLPTLFPRLVASRTYAERMFSVQEIGRLSLAASRAAIEVPLNDQRFRFSTSEVEEITRVSDGYPYFIQFICHEAFDLMRTVAVLSKRRRLPMDSIMRKLDADFFSGRWEILTDRQRELLYCIAHIEGADTEFTIPEILTASTKTSKANKHIRRFVRGDISQMLPRLIDRGLIYKNRHGKYSFAVPLFDRFIKRKYTLPNAQ